MNGEKIYKYLAVKVMEDIQNGNDIDEDLAKEVSRYPIIDYLRTQVKEAHLKMIQNLIHNSSSNDVKRLGVSLLNNLIRDRKCTEEIKAFLQGLWEKENNENKLYIMWKLLDLPDLDNHLHQEIYGFIKENWDAWLTKAVEWCGGKDKVLDVVIARLNNPSFPKTKAWIYLCNALGSPDTRGVRSLITDYVESKDSIVSNVAKELLQRI